MLVQPKENYQLLGTATRLNRSKVYGAVPATNLPRYKETGAVFVNGLLLVKGEYDLVNWGKE